MASIRSSGTKPEHQLAGLLRSMFPRRKIVEHPEGFPGRPDFLIPSFSMLIFVDGCFWHGCRKHGRIPEDNRDYWGPKLDRNRNRDRRIARQLRSHGYLVVRVWDHDLKPDPSPAQAKIRRALRTLTPA